MFDEKLFNIDSNSNSQDERVWAVNRTDVDKRSDIEQKRKFSQKVMMWRGLCSKSTTPLIILDEGIDDYTRYMEKVLRVAVKYGNKVFGND